MILQRCLGLRSSVLKKYLLRDTAITTVGLRLQEYSRLSTYIYHSIIPIHRNDLRKYQSFNSTLLLHRKWYSKGLLDGDVNGYHHEKGGLFTLLQRGLSLKKAKIPLSSHILATQDGKIKWGIEENRISNLEELKKITELFPEARVTLHILSSRMPEKMYDLSYKQSLAPKGGKKAVRDQDWTCVYKFVWPEKKKFECTALSKRVAAEKAATQALHWLYTNNRIDRKGNPLYDRNVIDELKSNLNEPFEATITNNSVERIERIWEDYENGIKEIFERTEKKAKQKAIEAPVQLTKDSTIDQEDDYPDDDDDYGDEISKLSDYKGQIHPVYGRVLTPPSEHTLRRRSDALKRKFEDYDESLTPLPIDEYAEDISSTIENNRVTVIVGAAGCGKSTRVPASILRSCGVDAAVVVSEPRRVAAIGLAERVASELNEEVGESIGYQVRLHSKPPKPPAGSVLYCTSGVLLNRLQSNPGLQGCTHVVIDEAHERDVNTDVTLLLLKRAMDINPDLKLIVMSATLDTAVFTKYFDSCPVIEVPGRTFPVEVSYLEDIQKKFKIQLPNTLANCMKVDGRPQLNVIEITEVIKAVDKNEKEGAVLVFLPGWAEIKLAKQILEQHYAGSTLHIVLPVHSRLSATDQSRMFAKPPPGVRKVVLATNVAETSVTIPDVVYVIDAGAHKENAIKEGTGTASLETVWVSLAGAKQRAGRAGRVQPGHCYRLYTKEKEAEFETHTTPEILRIPLEQTVLDCKTYAPEDKAQDFLSQLPEPPSIKAVKLAVSDLINIGALTPSEKLTRLGTYLSSLPLSPRAALALTHSAAACCVTSVANIAVHSETPTEIFLNAADRRDEIRDIKCKFSPTSDHAALHWIQQEFEQQLNATNWNAVSAWCDKYTLKKERLGYVQSLSSLYLRELLKTGLIETNLELDEINRFSDIDELSVAILLSGVDALLVTKRHVKTKRKLQTVNEVFTSKGDRAHIASESVNYALTKRTNKPTLVAYYGGYHSVERRALLVYKSSVITPHTAILFCMGDVNKKGSDGETTVLSIPRHNLKINVPTSQAETLLKARQMLRRTFQYHIDRDVKDIDYEQCTDVTRFKIRLLKAICRILVEANDNLIGESSQNVDIR